MFSARELHNIKIGIAEMESFYALDNTEDSDEITEAIDGAVDGINRLEKLLIEKEK